MKYWITTNEIDIEDGYKRISAYANTIDGVISIGRDIMSRYDVPLYRLTVIKLYSKHSYIESEEIGTVEEIILFRQAQRKNKRKKKGGKQ